MNNSKTDRVYLFVKKLKVCIEFFSWLAGPIFVVLASGLITMIIAIHFKMILPYYGFSLFKFNIWCIINYTFSIVCSFNLAFNYYRIVFTSPGYSSDIHTGNSEIIMEESTGDTPVKKGEGFSRYCKICKRSKPDRSHHCHVCKKCVLRMDHHCPWTSNCVGFHNHRFFVLFLFYLWMGCGYVAFMSFNPFMDSSNFKRDWESAVNQSIIVFTFVITLSVCVALTFMLGWHMYLVVSGQTTIEFYYNKFMQAKSKSRGEVFYNEYDIGKRINFDIFFGTHGSWYAWMFPSVLSPPGDGADYLTRTKYFNLSNERSQHYV